MAMNLALIKKDAALPVDPGADFSDLKDDYREIAEAQAETGVTVSFRAKLPSSGGKVFEILTGDETTDFTTPDFTGVIVKVERCNARFEGDGLGNPPVCASYDGIDGVEVETGECHKCEVCPHNKYGTAVKGRGKACKNMIRLWVLVPGLSIPVLVTLPPTSLSAWTNYRILVRTQFRTSFSKVSTRFSLATQANKSGHKYPVVKLSVVGSVPAEQQEFIEYVAGQLSQRVEITSDDYHVSDTAQESEAVNA